MSKVVARSEADFPTSLPPYGVWDISNERFSLHKTLAAVKNYVTAAMTNNVAVTNYYRPQSGPTKFTSDVKVYELHGNSWHLIYTMKKDDERDAHELWQGKAPSGPQAVTDDEVAEAIASIQSILGS